MNNISPAADRGIAPLALALVLLVVLSGCASSSPSPLVVDAALGALSADASDGDSGAVSAAVGGTGSSASETRPADTAGNSRGHAPVVVGVGAPVDGCDYISLVELAVDCWRANTSAVAYGPAFVARPNSSDSGVTISTVERIDGCGDDAGADTVGCAPLLDGDDPTASTEPVTVVIAVGYDDETTQMVLRHEFGHLLGLTRDDADAFPALSERVETTRLPEPDAGERESPFRERTVAVHADLSSVSPGERAAHETETDHALSYYEGGADGVASANLSFERVSNPEMADVTLSVPTFRDGDSGVRWQRTGVDADDDATLEWHAGGDLVVDADLTPSLVDWHVGAGPDYLSVADERASPPLPFRDGDPADGRAQRGLAGETAGNATTPTMTPRRTQEFPSVVRE